MPSLMYGMASYDRTTGGLPPLELINMFVEKAATSENSACIQSRPGLTSAYANGSGPIRAVYSNPGVLSGDVFTVTGSGSSPTLYRNSSSIGTLTSVGSGPIKIAGRDGEILVAGGGTMRSYNGTNIASAGFVGNVSNNVTSVCYINDRFVAIEAGSARFFWSALLDGRTWDVLNFATAERQPDNVLDIEALGDNIWLFGQATVEVWQNDGVTPFSRIEQVSFDKGIITTGALTKADNTLFFAGSDCVVYRASTDVPQRISEHWLEEKIRGSTNCSLFNFVRDGHEFVCLRLDSETFEYDCATEAWCEGQTSGANWIAQCAAMKGTVPYFGHSSTGDVMNLSGWQDLSASLTREFTAAVQLDAPAPINNVWLWAETGTALTITCEYSRDAGESWTSAGDVTVTSDGRAIAEWRRLGQFDAPGAMFRFSTSSNAPFRISAVKYNEPLGGRSRG
jgi:hypothetical protein